MHIIATRLKNGANVYGRTRGLMKNAHAPLRSILVFCISFLLIALSPGYGAYRVAAAVVSRVVTSAPSPAIGSVGAMRLSATNLAPMTAPATSLSALSFGVNISLPVVSADRFPAQMMSAAVSVAPLPNKAADSKLTALPQAPEYPHAPGVAGLSYQSAVGKAVMSELQPETNKSDDPGRGSFRGLSQELPRFSEMGVRDSKAAAHDDFLSRTGTYRSADASAGVAASGRGLGTFSPTGLKPAVLKADKKIDFGTSADYQTVPAIDPSGGLTKNVENLGLIAENNSPTENTLAATSKSSQVSDIPTVAALTDVLADVGLAGAVLEGMTGLAPTPQDVRDFMRLATGLYAAEPGSPAAVSATDLRRLMTPQFISSKAYKDKIKLLRAVLELPRLMAEGIVRVKLRTSSSEGLRQSMSEEGWKKLRGEPVADAVIVGAGPAGLSTALQAADKGARVVLFEEGWLAQSFSDAAMRAVYLMRSNSLKNSLAQEPFSDPELVKRVGLAANLKAVRAFTKRAAIERFARDGRPPIDSASIPLDEVDATVASARSELMYHFAQVAEEIERLGSKVVEKASVVSASKRADGLWEIRTSAGHSILARKFVLAQGQIGSNIQYTRDPDPVASALPENARILLSRYADLESNGLHLALSVDAVRAGRGPPRLPVVHDSLLGAPEVREYLSLLKKGSSVAVVGSGESAAKAVMEILRLNGGLRIHLYTKDSLAEAQLQIPAEYAAPDAIKLAQDNPREARKSFDAWKAFGAPITPASYSDIKIEIANSRLVVHAIGEYFDAREGGSIQAVWDGDSVHLKSNSDSTDITGALFWASGYDRKALRTDPLTASLEKSGSLRRIGGRNYEAEEFAVASNRIASAADPDLYIAGSLSFALSADAAISGAVSRAARIAEAIARPATPSSFLAWGISNRDRRADLNSVLGIIFLLSLGSTISVFGLFSQAAFWTANILAFAYIAPQIYRLSKNRSADISLGTAVIGFVSASVMTMDFAHIGQELMTYRNFAQAGGFAIVLGLKAWYDANANQGSVSRRIAAGNTLLALLGLGLLMILGGPLLLAVAPGVLWLSVLLVPFQMLSGLGFTWLMMPQFEKIVREGRIGDASEATAWGFVGTRTIWVWSLAMLAAIPIGGAEIALAPLWLFSLAVLAMSQVALSLVARLKLTRWKGFLTLATVMGVEVFLGWLILPQWASIPVGAESKYLMYLCYLVQNLTAFLAALMTARAFRRSV